MNSGKKWESNEIVLLLCEVECGLTLAGIAKKHNRTEGGIKSKIIQLGEKNIICKKYCADNNLHMTNMTNIPNAFTPVQKTYQKKKEMIYVLQLECNKYYVGWTMRGDGERFSEHFDGEGSEWTKKYKPINVLKWIDGTKQDEDRITLDLMKEFGWYNVRGGKWCRVEMSAPPQELRTVPSKIQSVIDNAVRKSSSNQIHNIKNILASKCKRCGRSNHTSKNCYARTAVTSNKYNNYTQYDEDTDESYNEMDDDTEDDDIEWKCSYCDKTFDTEKGVLFHENRYCTKKNKKIGKIKYKYYN